MYLFEQMVVDTDFDTAEIFDMDVVQHSLTDTGIDVTVNFYLSRLESGLVNLGAAVAH